MGKTRSQLSDEAVVIAVNRNVEPTRHVVLELGLIRDGLAVFTDISQGAGEQVGVPLLPEAEDHRCAHIKGVAIASEGSATATRYQVPLQHQRACSLGSQLAGGHQTADA